MESKYLPTETLASEVAEYIHEQIQSVLREKEICTLGLSGGKSPAALYQKLAKLLSADAVRRLVVFLVDERHVPFTSPDSNYKLIKDHFVSQLIASPRKYIYPTTFLSHEDAAAHYEKDLKDHLPFDLLILGLGEDGHTASLFPGEEYLGRDGRLIVAPLQPHVGFKRISLNYPPILDAHKVIFYVPGKNKKEILQKVCVKGELFPAQRILLRHHNLTLFREKI